MLAYERHPKSVRTVWGVRAATRDSVSGESPYPGNPGNEFQILGNALAALKKKLPKNRLNLSVPPCRIVFVPIKAIPGTPWKKKMFLILVANWVPGGPVELLEKYWFFNFLGFIWGLAWLGLAWPLAWPGLASTCREPFESAAYSVQIAIMCKKHMTILHI